MQQASNVGETLKLYQIIRQVGGRPSTLSDSVRDVNGSFIAENPAKVERWREHLKYILDNEHSTPLPRATESPPSPAYAVSCDPPSEGEFGDTLDSKYILLNHFDLKIRYAPQTPNGGADASNTMGKIISAEVTPRSIKHTGGDLDCSPNHPLILPADLKPPLQITYSYSVTFEEVKDVSWTSRWDYFLTSSTSHTNIQWLSIVNSLIVVIFLTGLVALVLVRTLYRDVSRYNKLDSTMGDVIEGLWSTYHERHTAKV
ncbi:unnamed protein product [Schistocephalus solidus]|uniref:Transmembrane 9 superfamily member n=1 Tax=Schistocephalus solidus TaxID=70667 RepID=A0A183T155_SCHSO|nr:unnamed protein product [Schistocephalus solidus]